MARTRDLTARLAPHVPDRFATNTQVRWPPPAAARVRWRPTADGRTRGIEQLAQVVHRWALLVATGDAADLALMKLAAAFDGDGARHGKPVGGTPPPSSVRDGLRVADEHLRSGADLSSAVRAWAGAAGCPHVTVLAADLLACTTVDATLEVLDRHALRLRRAGHEIALRRLRRRCGAILAAGAATCVATVLAFVA